MVTEGESSVLPNVKENRVISYLVWMLIVWPPNLPSVLRPLVRLPGLNASLWSKTVCGCPCPAQVSGSRMGRKAKQKQ